MKLLSSPALILLVSVVWITILSTGTDAQKRRPSSQQEVIPQETDNENNVEVDPTDSNDGIEKPEGDSDRRKGYRQKYPAKKQPNGRERGEELDDSNETSSTDDRRRKHWKKDKHMKKPDHGKKRSPCTKFGKHHPACRHYRRYHSHHYDHDHDFHHHHHHEDRHPRYRRPSHRRHKYDEEDQDFDSTRPNRGRGRGRQNDNDSDMASRRRGEREQLPKPNKNDEESELKPTSEDNDIFP